MSCAVYRQVTLKGGSDRAERLFCAAVSAFCSLPRPTRREVVQLDDLALPLFDQVSAEGRRHAAAALSECAPAPRRLVRRLAGEPVEIAAPLLLRSRTLSDVDLIGLIGQAGPAHARAIARRPNLHPTIAALIRALLAQADAQGRGEDEPVGEPSGASEPTGQTGPAAENARHHLRGMMWPAAAPVQATGTAITWQREARTFDRLRSAALTGTPALFQTALADALRLGLDQARRLTGTAAYSNLMCALRALDLKPEEAFLLTAAAYPAQFGHAEAIRLFLARFESLRPEAARDMVRGWRADALAARLQGTRQATAPSRPKDGGLKAS